MKNDSIYPPPFVSVIIPFYNQIQFLQESIESILNQSFTNWELLLIDDGSTDKSPIIAENFVRQFPDKIFLFNQPESKNRGASNARNIGVKNARGNFITFLDSDDVLTPEAIEKELAAFDRSEEADVVCGTMKFWYSWTPDKKKTDLEFIVNLGLEPEKLYQPPALLIHNLLAIGRKPGINCIMMKRDFINQIGAFEGEFRHVSEDQVFWAKVSLNGKIYVIDECLAKYRQHENSSCALLIKNNKENENWKAFLDWFENYLNEKNVQNEEVWKAFKFCRKSILRQIKFRFFKKIYRGIFPLHLRYWFRDKIISWRMKTNN